MPVVPETRSHHTGAKHVSPTKHPADSDEDPNDESYEEIGKGYTFSSKLSAAEKAALDLTKPSSKVTDDVEANPLPAAQRNATYTDILTPLKSHSLGEEGQAICIASSSTGNILAVGGRHGRIQLVNPHSLEYMDTLELGEALGQRPGTAARQPAQRAAPGPGARPGFDPQVVTALRFRPDSAASKMQNVLLAAQGDMLVHVHVGTQQVLSSLQEPGNSINALCLQPGGAKAFATAGSDKAVRVYDEATQQLACLFDHGDGTLAFGHSNHIFSITWLDEDPQVLLSGGWDHTVQVWDLRVQRAVRHISGPYICGDALDAQGGQVLTGSWRHAAALQLWDLGSGRLLTNLPWWQPEPDGCLVYAARFGRGRLAGTVVAGGSGHKPMVRQYHLAAPGNISLRATMLLQHPVHALELLHQGPVAGKDDAPVCAVCCDSELHLMPMQLKAH